MDWPGRNVLPVAIGLCVAATLGADVVMLVRTAAPAGRDIVKDRFVAAAQPVTSGPASVAPLKRRYTPRLLIVAPVTLPPAAVAKVRATRQVTAVEIVDAAQALVAGQRVNLLGVAPSTFRAFTPEPSAKSDPLWRNVAAGDIAVSFPMGQDGGVRLGSMVGVGGSRHQRQVRVGAYATMGIGEIDAVVSRDTARALGMSTANALLVSAPGRNPEALSKRLKPLLPRQARIVVLRGDVSGPTGPAKDLPRATGMTMSTRQVEVAIRAARTKLGMPYVWGGESDAEGGYDCSGIIQWAFARAGVRMPRVADDQARTGPRLPYSKARPGDLLIWAHDPTAPGYISHIAVYIGDGQMLVAPRRGDVVKIAPVYFRNFLGVVRVNPQIAARHA